jgi:hypothetical protein
MAWVVDKGILRLREQINAAAPNRSKASDGTIGDAAHSARDSDHNPESPAPAGNPDNQVDALDVTHDPAHGADMGEVSEAIRLSKDRRVKYVIFNRRIYSGRKGPQPWVWRPYTGTDPHTNHMHVSVEDDTHDQTQDWQITLEAPVTDSLYGLDDERRVAATNERTESTTAGQDFTEQTWLKSYATKPTREPNWLVQTVKAVDTGVTEIKTALASASAPVLTDEQLQALCAQLAPAVAAEVLRELRLHPLAPTV